MDLIAKIKEKRELSGLDNSVIEKALHKVTKGIDINKLKKREIKEIIKLARAELRIISGSFKQQTNLSNLNPNKNNLNEILSRHSSTKERLNYYPELTNLISELKIKSILDLGCGINPIALADKDLIYYASDINKQDLELVERFFNNNKIPGKTFVFDVREIETSYKELPSVDLCLLFKVLDVVEKKGHKLAEKIIKLVNAQYFLISFSTKTLSGKPMNHPQRGWIEQLLSRLGYKFRLIKSKNEIFYLFEKLS